MNKIKLTCTLLAATLFSQVAVAQSNSLTIIPQPNHVKIQQGSLLLSSKAALVFNGFKGTPANLDKFARQVLTQVKGAGAASSQKISLTLDSKKSGHAEGYQLIIDAKGVQITASTETGIFYGLQSLAQMVAGANLNNLPYVNIVDEPRYKYRGLHLDVGRHFFSMDFIKSYIDVMAAYKLNTFHWHLTEDQGWRIEIKKYPKLATIASGREGTLLNHYRDKVPQFSDIPYKGYYTQEEVKEVVRYAASKYITVIPEIELPGHSLAALSAYPEFGCGDNPGPYKAAMTWGIFEDVYCAGKEGTFNFVQDVLDEVLALFPSTYIHIGGDESPKAKWKTCKHCQKRIKDNNLKDEHELQSYFIKRVEKYLNDKGRKIIGWDEILEGGLAPNATVMGWRGVKGGMTAARQNHDVIMVPSILLYFDHREAVSNEEPITNSYGPTRKSSLKDVYSFNPSIDTLEVEKQKYIIGVQGNLWTEYVYSEAKAWYMVLPRILGLSEIAWTKLPNKNWDNFSQNRVPVHLAKFDHAGQMYRVPEPFGLETKTYKGEEFEFVLHAPVKGAKIYYNFSGYQPSEVDILYNKPIKIRVPKGEERTLKCVTIAPSGRRSVTTTALLSNK